MDSSESQNLINSTDSTILGNLRIPPNHQIPTMTVSQNSDETYWNTLKFDLNILDSRILGNPSIPQNHRIDYIIEIRL